MKDDELVKALRCGNTLGGWCYSRDCKHRENGLCELNEGKVRNDAATRIEQLAKENVSQQCKILMLTSEVEELRDAATRLQAEYDRLRNEHCNLCGRYKMAHEGSCDWCRWHRKGE